MFIRLPLLLMLTPLLLLSLACNSYDRRTFSLEVKNTSTKPITVGLAKNGPPMEVDWESPTERALMDPRNTGIGWGQVVPPGKTAYIDNLRGEFAPGVSGFLRVYLGDLPLNDILSIGPDSRNRFDLRLREGKTIFIVADRGPFIDIFVSAYEPAGEEAKRNPTIRASP